MISPQLLQGTASANPTRDAFDARSQQLQQQRDNDSLKIQQEQDRKDKDFHQVLQYAGDGFVEEARYFARSKGIDVPEAIFSNSAFAKGAAMSKDFYDGDPEAQQKYTMAFVSAPGDIQAKHAAAMQMAGPPVNQDEREFRNKTRLMQYEWNNKPRTGEENGFTLTPGQSRYDSAGNVIASAEDNGEYEAYQKAYNSAINGMMTMEQADEAGKLAAQQYNAFKRQGGGGPAPAPSPGLQRQAPTAQGAQMQGVYAVQQLLTRGYRPEQIKAELMRRGASEQQVNSLLGATGVR